MNVHHKPFVGKLRRRYKGQGPRVETIKQFDHQVLKCLECGSARMTVSYLDIYSAASGDDCYQHSDTDAFAHWDFAGGCVLECSKPASETAWAYNPSFTGHGLRLMMQCTDCNSQSQLWIAGHESITQTWKELIYHREA